MAIQDALKARLLADATLVSLVVDRVYWSKAPPNLALPCVLFRRIGGGPVVAMGVDTGLQMTRWIFVALANTPATAQPVLDRIKAALNRLHDTTVSGVFIDSIFMQDAEDTDLEPDIDTGAQSTVMAVNYRE